MKKAFTLIELMVVMVVVVVLTGITLGGLITSQRQTLFFSAYENVLQLVRDQRSLALSGKAIPDYTDYDKDGCKAVISANPLCPTVDLVTPANYGVSFDISAGTVTTFADLHKSALDTSQVEGRYDPPDTLTFYTYTLGSGKDVAMAQYTLDTKFTMVSNLKPSTAPFRVDIFYSPIFGDVTIKPAVVPMPQFLIFGITDAQTGRKKCAKIHPVSGVPEVATDAECVNP